MPEALKPPPPDARAAGRRRHRSGATAGADPRHEAPGAAGGPATNPHAVAEPPALPFALPDVATPLCHWQRVHGRHDLPWQRTCDPYRVWLSEIMLQQTQVATVLGYYERFLQRFPDVQALAAAPLDEVLALWSGLGYYRRARHLHRCAQVVVEQHGGRFPRGSAELATLPGIGRSTAAAIAAFCFGERVAILDGNVKRVLGRVLAFDGDLAQGGAERRLWALASALVPERDVEVYTQALMDLGATRCRARAPDCADCPLREVCRAHALGEQERYPVKSRRLTRGRRRHLLLWLVHRGRWWLARRPDDGVWAGLWSLPEGDDEAALQARLAPWPARVQRLATIEHALTHFDWELQPLRVALPDAFDTSPVTTPGSPWQPEGWTDGGWFAPEQALALGLPAPVRRLFESP